MSLIYPSHAGIKRQEAIGSHHLAKKALLGMVSSVVCSTIKEGRISAGCQI